MKLRSTGRSFDPSMHQAMSERGTAAEADEAQVGKAQVGKTYNTGKRAFR